MGHKKLREEKNCLNCGHTVEERFCTHCGQENLEIHDSALHLIIHYIQDMFHYDGKFWHTLKMLILKPGHVAKEYMEGKRSRNLEPLRFYVFASTVFFLLLFYFLNINNWKIPVEPKFNYQRRLYNLEQEKTFLEGSPDTAYVELLRKGVKQKLDSLHTSSGDTTAHGIPLQISFPAIGDSLSDGWLAHWIEKRADQRKKELDEKHEGDQNSILSDIMQETLHKLPQLLFLSMPFFAFLLQLLYFRKRRNYVDHFIFSIYFFAYLFVILGANLIVQNMHTGNKILIDIISYFTSGVTIYLFIYLILAMKRFYVDRWIYLIPRYLLLTFLFFFLLIILLLISIVVIYLWG